MSGDETADSLQDLPNALIAAIVDALTQRAAATPADVCRLMMVSCYHGHRIGSRTNAYSPVAPVLADLQKMEGLHACCRAILGASEPKARLGVCKAVSLKMTTLSKSEAQNSFDSSATVALHRVSDQDQVLSNFQLYSKRMLVRWQVRCLKNISKPFCLHCFVLSQSIAFCRSAFKQIIPFLDFKSQLALLPGEYSMDFLLHELLAWQVSVSFGVESCRRLYLAVASL